ncbi:MAG: RNA-binding S4 domain-containing protein [Magnetovibrio sp.]|nr:RNA-binding S4 domain-containing protein [Magnetovibrio sp.]
MSADETDGRRLDKWLWYARFFKSRTLATRFCQSGRLRVNGSVVKKAHHLLRPGDVLTFPKGPDVRVVEVVELGHRRGPATEARTLYSDLAPPEDRPKKAAPEPGPARAGAREPGSGRPTKHQRRALDRLRGG